VPSTCTIFEINNECIDQVTKYGKAVQGYSVYGYRVSSVQEHLSYGEKRGQGYRMGIGESRG